MSTSYIDETEPEFGCWSYRFISHNVLQYDLIKKSQYLKALFLINNKPMYT